ncbi:hypothetical protein [Denitratimonas sp. CY0512]|uniref:hypothetical protein n=1 Tax=Denitratimonas sp. CY0512 TaxID=3131940 RepID=UPI0030B2966D
MRYHNLHSGSIKGDVMLKFLARTAVCFLALGISSSVLAQSENSDRDEVGNVRTDEGVIMLSIESGPFNTTMQRQRVAVGDRLMVAKDSVATVVYDNGCEQKYDEAGVYEIERDCVPVVAWWGSDRGVMTMAVVGSAVLGGVIGYQLKDDDDPPPVSR